MSPYQWCLLFTCMVFTTPGAVSLITIMPNETAFVPLGKNVTFRCPNLEDFTFILISQNGETIERFSINDDGLSPQLPERNIFSENTIDGVFVLKILSSEGNNNTAVRCQDTLDTTEHSDTIRIIAIGAPLPPGLNFTFPNATNLLLKWNEPFTWSGHDVDNYTVLEVNSQGAMEPTTTADLQYSYSSPTGEVLETCQNVTFNVSAVSDLGSSEPATLTTALPIVLGPITNLTSKVLFTRSGEPEVDISFKPPSACQDQKVTLMLSIRNNDNPADESVPDVAHTYFGNPQLLSFFLDDLRPNTNYTVIITAESVAGSSNGLIDRNFFDTKPKPTSNLELVTGTGVAAGALVLTSLIVFFTVVVCCWCTRKRNKSINRRRRSLDGAGNYSQRDSTYDYIDDYQTVPSNKAYRNRYIPGGVLPPIPTQREDSPYEAMKPANSCSKGRGFGVVNPVMSPHYTDPPTASPPLGTPLNGAPPPAYTNHNMHVTPGGSVVFRSRGSEGSISIVGEGEYTTMSSAGTAAHQQKLDQENDEATSPERDQGSKATSPERDQGSKATSPEESEQQPQQQQQLNGQIQCSEC